MKVRLNEIEVIAWHKENKEVVPIQFRMDYKETVKVEQIIDIKKEKKAGIDAFVYECQTGGRRYTLKFFPSRSQWILYKM
ncbi:hypothetical protein ACTQ46_03945 [Gallicola sp. Sow4_E12]|uniref:hypothetical protein n=1 Tax=Gallicola sp. Sow4_E12 TaxID=3438785 RepID=UPI003F90AFCA